GEKLNRLSAMDRAFFCNSGSEANETAIKLARIHGHQRGINKPIILVMENSFHGRTLATLSATGNRQVQAGFEPLVQGFVRAPFGDLDSLRDMAANTSEVVAVFVEPIQGEGGIIIPPAGYLRAIRELCNEHGWLLMLDEVQTGMGRSGRMFAHQREGIQPDVMTLAKGLGNGVPIGACLAHGSAANAFGPGKHGSTFGGNPLACAAALTVIEILEQEKLIARAEYLGASLLSALQNELEGLPGIREIRGEGLLIGIELNHPCSELTSLALERGLLIDVRRESVIRLLPPLILSDDQADLLVTTLSELLNGYLTEAVRMRA
ncbi:MAG: aminotransferase class III-fold pyridoxal phosphate-dependent enzyme, partial [Gammaproteobacteria bacterium]|nr:aminotransferase class III-fold pyridoxal phosphate-dependent enzyme [Gammaproteobacteria bacterium]